MESEELRRMQEENRELQREVELLERDVQEAEREVSRAMEESRRDLEQMDYLWWELQGRDTRADPVVVSVCGHLEKLTQHFAAGEGEAIEFMETFFPDRLGELMPETAPGRGMSHALLQPKTVRNLSVLQLPELREGGISQALGEEVLQKAALRMGRSVEHFLQARLDTWTHPVARLPDASAIDEAHDVFEQFDVNEDGKLDAGEFQMLVATHFAGSPQQARQFMHDAGATDGVNTELFSHFWSAVQVSGLQAVCDSPAEHVTWRRQLSANVQLLRRIFAPTPVQDCVLSRRRQIVHMAGQFSRPFLEAALVIVELASDSTPDSVALLKRNLDTPLEHHGVLYYCTCEPSLSLVHGSSTVADSTLFIAWGTHYAVCCVVADAQSDNQKSGVELARIVRTSF